MAIKAQERLRDVMREATDIAAKGVLSKEDSVTLEGLITEGHALRGQIEQQEKLSELAGFAGKSVGSLPLVGGGEPVIPGSQVKLESLTPAGGTVIERSAGGLKMLEQYGEGIFDPKVMGCAGRLPHPSGRRRSMTARPAVLTPP